jgi:hypothetical protein
MESELGRLAQTHGGTPSVRRFGQLLVEDAQLGNRYLDDVAHRERIPLRGAEPLPAPIGLRLSGLHGTAFDAAFLRLEHGIGARTLAIAVQTAPSVDNGAASRVVRNLQPLFDQHLRLVVSLERKGK